MRVITGVLWHILRYLRSPTSDDENGSLIVKLWAVWQVRSTGQARCWRLMPSGMPRPQHWEKTRWTWVMHQWTMSTWSNNAVLILWHPGYEQVALQEMKQASRMSAAWLVYFDLDEWAIHVEPPNNLGLLNQDFFRATHGQRCAEPKIAGVVHYTNVPPHSRCQLLKQTL